MKFYYLRDSRGSGNQLFINPADAQRWIDIHSNGRLCSSDIDMQVSSKKQLEKDLPEGMHIQTTKDFGFKLKDLESLVINTKSRASVFAGLEKAIKLFGGKVDTPADQYGNFDIEDLI